MPRSAALWAVCRQLLPWDTLGLPVTREQSEDFVSFKGRVSGTSSAIIARPAYYWSRISGGDVPRVNRMKKKAAAATRPTLTSTARNTSTNRTVRAKPSGVVPFEI